MDISSESKDRSDLPPPPPQRAPALGLRFCVIGFGGNLRRPHGMKSCGNLKNLRDPWQKSHGNTIGKKYTDKEVNKKKSKDRAARKFFEESGGPYLNFLFAGLFLFGAYLFISRQSHFMPTFVTAGDEEVADAPRGPFPEMDPDAQTEEKIGGDNSPIEPGQDHSSNLP